MFRGLPLRSCLFMVSIAFFTNSSSLNSTTLSNQGKKGQRSISHFLEQKNSYWFEAASFLTHSPVARSIAEAKVAPYSQMGSEQESVRVKTTLGHSKSKQMLSMFGVFFHWFEPAGGGNVKLLKVIIIIKHYSVKLF